MVAAAQQHEVGDGRRAAVAEPPHVVGVAPVAGPVASGEPALLVADGDRVVQRRGDGANGPAVLEHFALGDHDAVQDRIAQQHLGRPLAETGTAERARAEPGGELGRGEHDVDVRSMAAAGPFGLVVQEVLAHVHEGVAPFLRRRADGFAGLIQVRRDPQRGGDELAIECVEVAVGAPPVAHPAVM